MKDTPLRSEDSRTTLLVPQAERGDTQHGIPGLGRAGFPRRALAYLIDVVPITIAVGLVYYFFLGYGQTVTDYMSQSADDYETRWEFLSQRNMIRDVSFLLYVLYAALLEGSPLQATIGKRIVGLRVVDAQGKPLTFLRSCGRSAAKILSYIPCALGFFWVAWSPEKQGWHDRLAHTHVIRIALDRDSK